MFNEGEWYNSNQLQAFQDHFLRFFSARTTRMLLVNDQHDGEGGHYRPQGSVDMVTKHSPNWSSQTDAYDSFEFYSREYYASPIKPILFGEPVPSYNGGSSQLRGIMRLLWGTVMGGASGFMLQNDTGWRWNPNALDPAFDVEGHASRFFNQSGIEFWNMEPREDVCSTSVCMASPDHYLVYSQGHATVTVYPDDTSGRYTVRFYNPRTGDYDPNVSQVDGAEEILITTPSTIDWVIWLAKQK